MQRISIDEKKSINAVTEQERDHDFMSHHLTKPGPNGSGRAAVVDAADAVVDMDPTDAASPSDDSSSTPRLFAALAIGSNSCSSN